MEICENYERMDELINYLLQVQDEEKPLLEILTHMQLYISKWQKGESHDFLYSIHLSETKQHCKTQVFPDKHCNQVGRDYTCNRLQIHSTDQHLQNEFEASQNQSQISIGQYDDCQGRSAYSNNQDDIECSLSHDQIY